MDKVNDKLVEYEKSYRDHCRALQQLNVMGLSEPYRAHFQQLMKDLAVHGIIVDAAMQRPGPPPFYFSNVYERQSLDMNRSFEELGAKVPIPAFLEQFSSDTDYNEDGD